jgi:molybdopterin converting factor subunit 1
MKRVKVLFFATYREYTGQRSVELELTDQALVGDVRKTLVEVFPRLADHIQSALIAIDKEFAFDEESVPDGSEVAVFPPVSGGAGSELPTIFMITEEALDLDRLLAEITLESSGAACFFTGMVRGVTTRGLPHETIYLEYEAFQAMAEAKMHQVAEEIRQRWPEVEGIAIVQRVGRLYPGTPTVLIACTAAHRDTGVFEAARYGIDRLKEIVPVWKKEVSPAGEEWIEGEYIPRQGD